MIYLPYKDTALTFLSAQPLEFSNSRSHTYSCMCELSVFQRAVFSATLACVFSNSKQTYVYLQWAPLHLSSFSLGQFNCNQNQSVYQAYDFHELIPITLKCNHIRLSHTEYTRFLDVSCANETAESTVKFCSPINSSPFLYNIWFKLPTTLCCNTENQIPKLAESHYKVKKKYSTNPLCP